MVGIRSITYQLPNNFEKKDIEEIEKLSRVWDKKYSFIRTQRVSLCPYSLPMDMQKFKDLSRLCDLSSVRWFNVPIKPIDGNNSEIYNFAYSILAEYSRAFVNVIGVESDVADPLILNQYSELMRKVSMLSNDGKDNFRLGMSVNVKPDGPFFPFTYSSGVKGFSIGLELTQDINVICEKYKHKGLLKLRDGILECLLPQIDEINEMAIAISSEYSLEFKGFDFSLAPIIDKNGSIISILNSFGVYDFGKTGSLFATGFITNILKNLALKYKSVGFSGVMYSLLEDLELCSINNQRGVTLQQMISLSTMCGCGVDMIPVYGQMTNEELYSIYLEVIGISCRLNSKPLGIRLLPIPYCKRGSKLYTHFTDDPDFIANTKVVTPDLNLLNRLEGKLEYLQI